MSNGKRYEVPYGQNPYSAIGKYIRDNIDVIEDIIAVIELNGEETNELFMVDFDDDGLFIWKSDWWEGEEKVVLLDFFPVSEATHLSEQPERKKGKWIYGENDCQDGWFCSECRFFIPWDYDYYGLNNINFIKDFHVCPHCKAEMVTYTGKNEDTDE